MQYYRVDKVHCVWISDGEVNVLIETDEKLRTVRFEFVLNKDIVTKYLSSIEYVPHLETVITMKQSADILPYLKQK